MDFLDFIPKTYFEILGTVVGMFACAMVGYQAWNEWRIKHHSSMSITYLLGWAFIFLFWTLYGVRSRTFAIFVSNGIATVLQILLTLIVLNKIKNTPKRKAIPD